MMIDGKILVHDNRWKILVHDNRWKEMEKFCTQCKFVTTNIYISVYIKTLGTRKKYNLYCEKVLFLDSKKSKKV